MQTLKDIGFVKVEDKPNHVYKLQIDDIYLLTIFICYNGDWGITERIDGIIQVHTITRLEHDAILHEMSELGIKL